MALLLTSIPRLLADDVTDTRIEEFRLVVRSLRAENERLRARNDALANEIVRLRQLLTEDAPPQEAGTNGEPVTSPEPGQAAQLPGHNILYVNPTWHYVILDAGSEEGLSEGHTGRVMRDRAEIGRATVTAVKPAQAVADLDMDSLRDQGHYPRAGDRVMFLPQP